MNSMHRECAKIIGPCVHPKALLFELATVLPHFAARLESVVRSSVIICVGECCD